MSKLIHITTDDHDTRTFKEKEIDRWELQYTGCVIIRSSYKSEEELDLAWEKFNQMPFELQLVADDEALKLFGITNAKMYRRLKKVYLRRDIDNGELIPLVYAPKDAIIESQGVEKNRTAYRYMRDTGYPMVTDVDSIEELDNQWYKFCNTDKDIRTKSDGESIKIFGMSNEEHYQSELNKLLRQDIEDTGYDEIDSVIGESTNVSYLVSIMDYINENSNLITAARMADIVLSDMDEYSLVESDIVNYIVTRFNTSLRESSIVNPYIYAPFYPPDELAALGVNKYTTDSIEGTKLIPHRIWYNNYKASYYGIHPNKWDIWLWKETVSTLMHKFNREEDENKKQSLKEAIIGYGWNPYVEFTRENLVKVSQRVNNNILSEMGYNFIDIQNGFTYPSKDIKEIQSVNGMYVVFVSTLDGVDSEESDVYPKVYVGLNTIEELYPIRNGYMTTPYSYDESTRRFMYVSIYYIPITEELYNKIVSTVKYIVSNGTRFGYNFLYQICIQLSSQCPDITNQRVFCTYLINMILQIVNSNLASPGSAKILPLLSVYDKKYYIYKVYDGFSTKLLPEDIYNKVRSLNTYENKSTTSQLESYDFIKPLLHIDPLDTNIQIKDLVKHEQGEITLKELENMFSFE